MSSIRESTCLVLKLETSQSKPCRLITQGHKRLARMRFADHLVPVIHKPQDIPPSAVCLFQQTFLDQVDGLEGMPSSPFSKDNSHLESSISVLPEASLLTSVRAMLARVNSDKTETQILVVLQGPWYHMASQTYSYIASSSMCLVFYTFFKLNCSWLNAKHVCWPSLAFRFQIRILPTVIQTKGHVYIRYSVLEGRVIQLRFCLAARPPLQAPKLNSRPCGL